MLHPDTELRFVSDTIGYGVFATRRIPRGTITWVRDPLDQTFAPTQIAALPPMVQQVLGKYGFVDPRGDVVLCWDHGRYVNHSCSATCLSPGHQFEIAVRDIEEGEELTDDYATLNLEYGFSCACGSATCRREVTPEDCLTLAERWDQEVAAAYPAVGAVAQPLWDLVVERELVEEELAGRRPVASCRANLRAFVAGRRSASRRRSAGPPRTTAAVRGARRRSK